MNWLIDSDLLGEHILVAVVSLVITALVVTIHFEGLHALARRFSVEKSNRNRYTMLQIIFALLALHIVEIWCYGLAYWLLLQVPDTGFVHGEHGLDTLFDAVYLSATTYSTLGIGDLAPVGAIRLLVGLESLTGLLMISWSASFTYLEMERFWRK